MGRYLSDHADVARYMAESDQEEGSLERECYALEQSLVAEGVDSEDYFLAEVATATQIQALERVRRSRRRVAQKQGAKGKPRRRCRDTKATPEGTRRLRWV